MTRPSTLESIKIITVCSNITVYISFFKIYDLCQFCSPVFGFFWFVPSFVEFDYVVNRFQSLRVGVTEFEAVASDVLN